MLYRNIPKDIEDKIMKKIRSILLLALFLMSISAISPIYGDEPEIYEKIQKGLDYFQKVYTQVQSHYVEEIDPYEFMKAGIDGMLATLDPYTVFIEQEGDIRLQIITTGKYGGLGMEIDLRDDQITVIKTLENAPARTAGILPGDIIQKIDGKDISNLKPQDISQMLRGPVQSTIELTLYRPYADQKLNINLQRQEITIADVDYFDYITPGFGYIRLTGFTEKAEEEVKTALKELQQRGTLKALILDIRGNSGGLLDAAVEISNIFLQKNTLIVRTKGFRDGEAIFKTESDPILPSIPLAVLIDGGSASASEIVAGALQDLDRAITVGEETFGKGLVQKVYDVDRDNNTKIKVTTAKYYIPSGRCVQKEDFTKDKNVFINPHQDSLKNEFYYTMNQRVVFESGGITPDKVIKAEINDRIMQALYKQHLFFNFAVKYHHDQPDWHGPLTVSDDMFQQFIDFIYENNFYYYLEGEKELQSFIEKSENHSLPESLVSQGENLLQQLITLKHDELLKHKNQIKQAILIELSDKYFSPTERIRYSLQDDVQLLGAIEVLGDEAEYKKILVIK
jgi:carboxyl-terminal processing protease